MRKLYRSESGFSFIEILLAVLVLALIGLIGWGISKDHSQAAPTTLRTTATAVPKNSISPKKTGTSNSSVSPYAGWNSYTLAQEQLSFRYPTTWQLSDKSDNNDDYEVLTGPNNFSMMIGAGAAVSAINISSGPIEAADPVTFNGQTAYLDAVSANAQVTGPVYEVLLSGSSTQPGDFFPTKNIAFNAANSRIIVQIDYWGSDAANPNTETLSYVENDVNYHDAQLVVESMSY